MSKNKKYNSEYEVFNKLSQDWWDENGKFESLHKFTDIRIQYINRIVSKYKKNFSSKNFSYLCANFGPRPSKLEH